MPTHAPRFSLYVGGRINFVGFGGSFLVNDQGVSETTGRLAGNGAGFQLDLGARLGKSWIPYGFIEHGLLGKGGHFQGEDSARSSTTFYGGGLRHVSGNPDSVGFMQDISIGLRQVRVSRGVTDETFNMKGLEYFRLGLGAEIRIHTRFVLSPMASISAGALSDSEGTITYAASPSRIRLGPASGAGVPIDSSRPYVVLSIGCGFHFDLIGD